MSEMLSALKADLLDRRLLPFVVLLALALVGALAYAVLGGKASSSATPSAPLARAGAGTSTAAQLGVKQAPANPDAAISETTHGARYRQQGGASIAAHNPFTALSAPHTQTTSSAAAAPAAGTSAPATTGTGSSGSATTPTMPSTSPTQTTETTPTRPEHKTVFAVSVLFGLAPTTPGQLSQLTTYGHLERKQPLPSSGTPLIVFEGVSPSGKGAIFALAREAILKGDAECIPSSTQCEAIDLKLGQTEELSYLEANGETVDYELAVASIASKEVSSAQAAQLQRTDGRGAALLQRLNPTLLDDMRFSSAKGLLVYVAHHGA